jgi:hypothetical protein
VSVNKSSFVVEMVGFQAPPTGSGALAGFDQGVSRSDRYALRGITPGTDDEQIEAIVSYTGTLAANGNASLDLKTLTDRYGVAAAAVNVKAGIVRNTGANPAHTGIITVGPHAVNGWDSFITDTVIIPAFGGVAWWCFKNGALVVDGTHKVVYVAEIGGVASADVEVQLWVEK